MRSMVEGPCWLGKNPSTALRAVPLPAEIAGRIYFARNALSSAWNAAGASSMMKW